MPGAVFTELVFVVEQKKGSGNKSSEVKKKITDNGGVVSHIVTEETTFVLIGDPTDIDHTSPHLEKARQYNVPVIGSEYVEVCLRAGQRIPHDDFTVIIKTIRADEHATISPRVLIDDKPKAPTFTHPSRVAVWNWSDPNSPPFPNGEEQSTSGSYELVKSVLLQKTNDKEEVSDYCVLEIHSLPRSEGRSQESHCTNNDFQTFRIFAHHGNLQDVKDIYCGKKECRFTKTGKEAEQIYSYLFDSFASQGFSRITSLVSRWIGSPVYRKRMLQSLTQTMELADEVAYLVDYVWKEAMGILAAILRVPVRSITLQKVEKAEAILLETRRAIDNGEDETTIHGISERFYALIPHRPEYEVEAILTKMAIARKQDICQLIKDIVNANESTGWSQLSDAVSKYRALNCVIDWLKPGHSERERVEKLVLSTQDKTEEYTVTIRNVFAVSRSVEEAVYNHAVGNDQLLMHCSRPANFLGILSRGLLLPKIVVSELGVGRRDAGMLGSGLYFGDKFSTAYMYSSAGELTGTRLMVVARVALGRVKEIFKHDTSIEAPTEGYNSMHGVCQGEDIQSDFTEDELVVYASNQQCIQYVVEFASSDDTIEKFTRTISVEETDYGRPTIEKLVTKIDVADVQCAPNPVANVQTGLVAKDQNQLMVELQAVHVRARIQDLAAKVIVLQSYKNHSANTIEAKYVFPLDDDAAICGFEAFINNKHVVGVIKEKEEAKQEYRRAIAAGHGAYLMDEEAPNVFSVSVGNLPPKANVLIKISYVTELAVEGGTLAFNMLGSVAPWKRKDIKAKNMAEDSEAYHVDANAQNRQESLQLSLHMASTIYSIQSPTHAINVKHKDTYGSVELSGGAGLGDSFQLFIGLAEIYSPRLWVETHPDNASQAAMLVFYPEFVTDVISEPEIIIMLDLSNSMQGSSLEEARALTQVVLKELPATCTFNVVLFGTEYEELFPSCQLKRKSSLDTALKFVKMAKANKGSTEAWYPLHSYFLLKHSNATPCNIFLLSDGHVTNEEATLAAISQNRENSRIFTFGISSTANHHTLRSMSQLGGGAFECFDTKSKSTWEKKVRRQVTRSMQPAVSNIRLEWQGPENDKVMQAPSQITTVFSGSRLSVFAFVPPTFSQVVLKADIPTTSYGYKEVITEFASEDLKKSQGMMIHQLAARSIVRDWEEGALHADRLHHEARKNELQSSIIPISKAYSIITPFTSFIAVEERTKEEDLNQETKPCIEELVAKEYIDDLPSLDWHEITPHVEVNAEIHVKNLLRTANTATQMLSFDAAEKYYESAYKVADEKLTPGSTLTLEIADSLSKFYMRIRRSARKAFTVIDKARKKHQEIKKSTPQKDVTGTQELQQLDQLDKVAEWAQLCKHIDEGFKPADIGPSDAFAEETPSKIPDEVGPLFPADSAPPPPLPAMQTPPSKRSAFPPPKGRAQPRKLRALSRPSRGKALPSFSRTPPSMGSGLPAPPPPPPPPPQESALPGAPLLPGAAPCQPGAPGPPSPPCPPAPPCPRAPPCPPRLLPPQTQPSQVGSHSLLGAIHQRISLRKVAEPSKHEDAADPLWLEERASYLTRLSTDHGLSSSDEDSDDALWDDDVYGNEDDDNEIYEETTRGVVEYDVTPKPQKNIKFKEHDEKVNEDELLAGYDDVGKALRLQADSLESHSAKHKVLGFNIPSFLKKRDNKSMVTEKRSRSAGLSKRPEMARRQMRSTCREQKPYSERSATELPRSNIEVNTGSSLVLPRSRTPMAERKYEPKLLDTPSIEKLLGLQHESGNWQFSRSFDIVLSVDSRICTKAIDHSGTAATIFASIQNLFATILAVFHLRAFLRSQQSEKSQETTVMCTKVKKHVLLAMSVIRGTLKDQSVHDKLVEANLGTNWDDIAVKLIKMMAESN